MTGSHRLHGEEVTGYEILDAREQRAARQRDWLQGHEDCCLVSVTMNIAGPVKSTPPHPGRLPGRHGAGGRYST